MLYLPGNSPAPDVPALAETSAAIGDEWRRAVGQRRAETPEPLTVCGAGALLRVGIAVQGTPAAPAVPLHRSGTGTPFSARIPRGAGRAGGSMDTFLSVRAITIRAAVPARTAHPPKQTLPACTSLTCAPCTEDRGGCAFSWPLRPGPGAEHKHPSQVWQCTPALLMRTASSSCLEFVETPRSRTWQTRSLDELETRRSGAHQ